MLLPVVKLKTPRNSRHPWIYKKMVQAPRGFDLAPGSLVEVRDKGGSFAAVAFYHPENTIALRLLSERPGEDVDAGFLKRRFARAKALREETLGLGAHGDSYRLVNAEADGLPGLVVDKFANVLVVEPYCAGWLHLADQTAESLKELYPKATVAFRADPRVEAKEGVSFAKPAKRYPPPPHADILENGLKYRVDFRTGHKTGFFLDQRDNRFRVGAMAKGRNVLDLCCYSGGFALSAWKGGAKAVTGIDLDEEALATARTNLGLNGADKAVRLVHADVHDELRRLAKSKERFGMIVLDPPKLASGQEEVEPALKAYFDFNRAALTVAGEDAIFATFSCSGSVSAERWTQTVRKAAAEAGRTLTILFAGGPGPDHPVSSDFPQGQYLKALFARVD